MPSNRRRKILLIAGSILATLVILGAVAIALLNPALTRYLEGPEFRTELEKQTAKGLHFPSSKFAPLKRTGFLSAKTASVEAQNGRKAMTSLDARQITAHFNPLGIFLRRWQLDELHIENGEVAIQIYEPQPTPTPSKPWYHVILPDHVYLKRIWSDPADVTWRLQGKKGGIFATHLEITPHGRDFKYRGTGGKLKNPIHPDLELREAYLLITKELFTLYYLDLDYGGGTIHGEGTAQTRGQKDLDFRLRWGAIPIRDWLPKKWDAEIAGKAEGELRWTGRDFKLDTGKISGPFRVRGGRASNVSFLKQIAAITKRKDFEQLDFTEFRADFAWDKGDGKLKNIAIEDKGKFRLEGNMTVNNKQSLGGTLQLGIAPDHLEWLPSPEEVFPHARDGYLWTTVHLSGTLDAPEQDLSPRLIEAMKEDPFAFLGAAFRAFGAWLRGQ